MDTIYLKLVLICPFIFLAGLVDSVAGGGGLISLPIYLTVGLPPHLATATNKCSSTFGTLFSMIRFMKGKKIYYLSAISSAVFALIGSSIGASINMVVDEKYLRYLLVIILPIIAGIVFFKKDFGQTNQAGNKSKRTIVIFSIFIGFFIGMYDGFFGPGTGTFLILCYTAWIGFDLVTASANAKVVNLSSNIAAFLTFALSGKIVWEIGLPAALFGILGNYLGAELAMKNGKKIIRPVFFIVLFLLLLKIMFDFVS